MTTEATQTPAATASADKTTTARAEELYETAREKTEEAYDATVAAVKKHPGTAAAIATGAVAAVAGAVFGASKLMNKNDTAKKSTTTAKKK